MSALLDACRAAPDDDAPRLVLADALGGERGEFIVIQCALARGGLAPAESAALRRRQRELVATHGVAWSGLALLAKTVAFRRGFVDSTMIDAAVLADRADEVFAAAPLLRHVALTGLGAVGRTPGPDPLPVLRAALEHLAGIAGLHVDSIGDLLETGVTGSPYTFASVETEGFALVLASGVLASARSLSLPQVPSPTVAALVGSGQLAGITRFASANGTASTFALVAQMPALRALELRLERGYPAVFPPLEELRVADLTDDALAALAASPAAATLERLSLRNVRVDRGLAALAKLPRLRALRIEPSPQVHHHIDLASMLATERFPALRELACVELAVPAAFAIATSLGPQLELFDLRGSAAELHVRRDELQSAIAGDLLTGAWQPPHRLAFLGREPHEPLWDMPLVELPRILLAK